MGIPALRITAVSLALLVTMPALAQEATDGAETAVVTTDDGFDWGWLGLLGLAGLAGLRRRETPVVHTTTTPRL